MQDLDPQIPFTDPDPGTVYLIFLKLENKNCGGFCNHVDSQEKGIDTLMDHLFWSGWNKSHFPIIKGLNFYNNAWDALDHTSDLIFELFSKIIILQNL